MGPRINNYYDSLYKVVEVSSISVIYSSGQNKVSIAEWISHLSRSIVTQLENNFCLRAILVTFFFKVLKYMHIKIFCHTSHWLLPPCFVALTALQIHGQFFSLLCNIPNISGLPTTIPVLSQQVQNDLSHAVILQDSIYPLCCFPTETSGNF